MAYVFDIYLSKLTSGAADWSSLDVRMLVTENATVYTPSKALSTVAAVLGVCTETTATGYARQALTGESDDPATDKRVLSADAVTFPITQAGKTLAGGLLYAFDTDDATSWPISWHPEVAGVTLGTDVVWVPTAGIIEVVRV